MVPVALIYGKYTVIFENVSYFLCCNCIRSALANFAQQKFTTAFY